MGIEGQDAGSWMTGRGLVFGNKMLEEITPPRMQDREELMYVLINTDEFVEKERIKEAEEDARREAELEHLDTDQILNF